MQISKDFIDIAEAVSRSVQVKQNNILETLESGLPNKVRYIELQIERLKTGRYGDTPNIHVRIKGISTFGYYKLGWDAAENGADYEVPKTLYKWDKDVLSEIEKKGIEKQSETIEQIANEAVVQYVEGAADAWVYHWLQDGPTDRGTEPEGTVSVQRKPMLQWNADMKILATLFYDLIEVGAITSVNHKTNSTGKKEVARMLASNFIGEKGEPLNEGSVENVLKTHKGKSRFRIDKELLKNYINKEGEGYKRYLQLLQEKKLNK